VPEDISDEDVIGHIFRFEAVAADKGTRQIHVILYAKEPAFRASAFAVSQR
jgi:hypothetical protein